MFSRSGATTIIMHKVFTSNYSNIDEVEQDIRKVKKHRGFAQGAA